MMSHRATTRSPACLILVILLSSTVVERAAAEQNGRIVGYATAITGSVYGTSPGRGRHTLIEGAPIIFGETVNTSGDAIAQLTFEDRSTINISPDSTLVIDNFVYDPEAASGTMSTSLKKGMMRFVGGQISHTTGVSITTPAVTVGIRGGIATVAVDVDRATVSGLGLNGDAAGGTLVVNHFGQTTVLNGARQVSLERSGFAIAALKDGSVLTAPMRVTPESMASLNIKLSSARNAAGGTRRAKLEGTRIPLPQVPLRAKQVPPFNSFALSGITSGANALVRSRMQAQRANQLNQELLYGPAAGSGSELQSIQAVTPATPQNLQTYGGSSSGNAIVRGHDNGRGNNYQNNGHGNGGD